MGRRTGAVAVLGSVLMLIGCGAEQGAEPGGSGERVTASADPGKAAAAQERAGEGTGGTAGERSGKAGEKPVEQVEQDLQAALRGIAALTPDKVEPHRADCQVSDSIPTAELAGEAELQQVTDRLRERGWDHFGGDGAVMNLGDGSAAVMLEHGIWAVTVGSVRLEREQREAAGVEFAIAVDAIGRCGRDANAG
ncbi:hypothetical protein [Streptomyces jumonjinensis]|uniref:hypothetical protein n=1 Tax=Streptomyces jumonjinensis TaxID=1945 RepID=UPI00378D73BA